MDGEKTISAFQILDWRILNFDCVNPIIIIPADIAHHWALKAYIDNYDDKSSDNQLCATVRIEFKFYAEHERQRMEMNGQCLALCTMNKGTVDDEQLFQNLLSRTALTNCLANLRVFLLQAGTLHQMGSKRLMLPFINLNNFSFEEEYTFTV